MANEMDERYSDDASSSNDGQKEPKRYQTTSFGFKK